MNHFSFGPKFNAVWDFICIPAIGWLLLGWLGFFLGLIVATLLLIARKSG